MKTKEKPFEKIVENGGFCGIFQKIGCIGDSLLSGAFETTNKNGEQEFVDFPEYLWGNTLKRYCKTSGDVRDGGVQGICLCERC